MKKALAFLALVVLIAAGVWHYAPVQVTAVFLMYKDPLSSVQGGVAPPLSSVHCTADRFRLNLEYIAIHHHYRLFSSDESQRNYMEVALVLEHLDDVAFVPATTLEAELLDDQGRTFRPTALPQLSPLPDRLPDGSAWRMILRFPSLTSQATSLQLNLSTDTHQFTLVGAALP
ncbi:MAG: hypothetical protein ACOX18_01765 [Bacillota bacterium]|jgi:hypothetical protein